MSSTTISYPQALPSCVFVYNYDGELHGRSSRTRADQSQHRIANLICSRYPTQANHIHQQSYKHEVTVEKGRIIMSIENSNEGILATARRILTLGPYLRQLSGPPVCNVVHRPDQRRARALHQDRPRHGSQRRLTTRCCLRIWLPPSDQRGSAWAGRTKKMPGVQSAWAR